MQPLPRTLSHEIKFQVNRTISKKNTTRLPKTAPVSDKLYENSHSEALQHLTIISYFIIPKSIRSDVCRETLKSIQLLTSYNQEVTLTEYLHTKPKPRNWG